MVIPCIETRAGHKVNTSRGEVAGNNKDATICVTNTISSGCLSPLMAYSTVQNPITLTGHRRDQQFPRRRRRVRARPPPFAAIVSIPVAFHVCLTVLSRIVTIHTMRYVFLFLYTPGDCNKTIPPLKNSHP